MRHYTAGHRLLPHDIVISGYVTFSLEDGTEGETVSWYRGKMVSWSLLHWDGYGGWLTFATCCTSSFNFFFNNHKFGNAGHKFLFNFLFVSSHLFKSAGVFPSDLVGDVINLLKFLFCLVLHPLG